MNRNVTWLLEQLGNISLFHWLTGILIFLFGALLSSLRFIFFSYKKERILFNNRNKPIKVFHPSDKTMDIEVKILKRSGLFVIERPTSDHRDIHSITNNHIVVVGFSKSLTNFNDILDRVMEKNSPIIIYTFGDTKALTEYMPKLQTYPWYSISTTPLRLLSDVFTVSSAFPFQKHNSQL